ncbi:MAG TPA: murein L,D-transpeptidase catalytic domain family protein [Flavisolibacter sp.]
MKKHHFVAVFFVTLSLALVAFISPSKTLSAAEKSVNDSVLVAAATNTKATVADKLMQLNLQEMGLSQEAVTYAVKGYEKLVASGTVTNPRYLTIVDFSQNSRNKRFYLLDVEKNEVVMNTYVSHGRNSGLDKAENFSNRIHSNQSSLGFYVTKTTYTGKHGKSLRLAGMEEGFNDNAEARAIVVHGADYVNPSRVNSGYMGRSQGCPALSKADYQKVIDLIRDGSVMFLYHPTAMNYVDQSPLLN